MNRATQTDKDHNAWIQRPSTHDKPDLTFLSDKCGSSIKHSISSSRQRIARYAAITLLAILCPLAMTARNHEPLKAQLHHAIAGYKAQVGIAIVINGKDTLTINNGISYPMMSVYKFHQALATARHMEEHAIPLDTMIYVKKEELHPDTYSPFRDEHPEGNAWFSVRELLTYTLQWSDNNACDILFSHIINTKQTDSLLRSIGVSNFNISATEQEMHNDINKCHDNWSTPLASAQLLDDFVAGRIVEGEYHDFILHTMLDCTTGEHRLPAGLPAGTPIGHKTGTSGKDKNGMFIGVNDIGFVYMNENTRFSIAVYVTESSEDLATNERIIAEVARKVYLYLKETHISE